MVGLWIGPAVLSSSALRQILDPVHAANVEGVARRTHAAANVAYHVALTSYDSAVGGEQLRVAVYQPR